MELTNLTGETSGLAVLDGLEVYFLDHVESEEEVTVRGWTGQQVPPHLVPSGLALLAGLPATTVDRYLRGDLEQATEQSIVDPAVIRERIAALKEVGHVWFEREFDPDLNSVAAPVWGDDGTVIAALHVHGPAYRFPDRAAMQETGKLVSETASQLAAQLTDGD
jgi:DNA-binding IclR family transcriptional regulator